MVFSRESLDKRLSAIRDQKGNRDLYMKGPQNYEAFMPAALSYEPRGVDQFLGALDSVGVMGPNETNITRVKEQNLRDFLAMNNAKEELQRARQNARQTDRQIQIDQKRRPEITVVQGNVRDVNRPNRPSNGNRGNRNGRQPHVSNIRNLDPWAGPKGKLVSVDFHGRKFVVNQKAAPIFTALLQDLWRLGYRPKVIGGYSDRNIAGTNTKSLHSLGYAIDIDPVQNPVQSNDGSMQYALPAKVRALAKKYGLSWGGDWSSYKDPMHFSVAYGGRE
jgi:hypothetical protein